VIFAIS